MKNLTLSVVSLLFSMGLFGADRVADHRGAASGAAAGRTAGGRYFAETGSNAQGEIPKLPNNFRVHEKVISFPTTKFVLQDANGNGNLGTITEKFLSLTTAVEYKDPNGNLVATAKEKFFSLGSTIDVFDPIGKKIGTIKEKIFNSLFRVSTEYTILDANGNEIATSGKLELFSTKFTIKDNQGQLVAEMKRPVFNLFSDNWSVSTSNNHSVDPRIVALIPVFKTIADNQRKSQND